MIEFKNLTIGFDKKPLLKNLHASLARGEVIALMGKNGVGKSCLLKTLASLNSPIQGSLTLDDKDLYSLTASELAKTLSIVLTERPDVDFLTVEELLNLGRAPFQKDKSHDEKIIAEVTSTLEIESLKTRYFSDLSDGQKQKVLVARALIQEPQYLFLDEPTTFLDIPTKLELIKIFKKVASSKKTAILFSTHDWEFVKEVDKIWLIDTDGFLHCEKPEALITSGLLKKNFNL
jgi:iron complex transport system ATP-binding protein